MILTDLFDPTILVSVTWGALKVSGKSQRELHDLGLITDSGNGADPPDAAPKPAASGLEPRKEPDT